MTRAHTLWQDPGSIEVTPDPVEAGESAEVKYDGDGTLWVSFGSEDWEPVKIDAATGLGTVDVPPTAEVMILSNRKDVPEEAVVPVISESRP